MTPVNGPTGVLELTNNAIAVIYHSRKVLKVSAKVPRNHRYCDVQFSAKIIPCL